MEYLGEKVAYLKGLADGMKIDESSNEGKLLKNIIDVLDDFAAAIADIEDSQELLSEHIESIDEDLAEVESEVYEDFEDEEEYDEDYDDEEEEVEYFEVECPNCHETVYLDEDMFDNEEEIVCPNCKETIEIEFECDCGCDHDHDHQ